MREEETQRWQPETGLADPVGFENGQGTTGQEQNLPAAQGGTGPDTFIRAQGEDL